MLKHLRGLSLLLALLLVPLAAHGYTRNTSGTTNDGVLDALTDLNTGVTPGRVITTSSTNCSNLKSTAGVLYSISGWATNNQYNFIRLYDLSSAPTANVSTVSHMYGLFGVAGGTVLNNPVPAMGLAFSNGIGICITGAGTATDNTSAVGGAVINYGYK